MSSFVSPWQHQKASMFLEGMKIEYWEIKWINPDYAGSFDIQSTRVALRNNFEKIN